MFFQGKRAQLPYCYNKMLESEVESRFLFFPKVKRKLSPPGLNSTNWIHSLSALTFSSRTRASEYELLEVIYIYLHNFIFVESFKAVKFGYK